MDILTKGVQTRKVYNSIQAYLVMLVYSGRDRYIDTDVHIYSPHFNVNLSPNTDCHDGCLWTNYCTTK